MIKPIHIAPIDNMLEVNEKYNKGLNMILTHLVLNNIRYAKIAKQLPGEKYLDNSFFELGYSLKPNAILEAAKLVNATVLICPDGTMDGAEEFKKEGYKIMCIPKTSSQFKDFMYDNRIDYVGVSEEHLDYRHSPGARYELFRDNIDAMMPKKKIHLLGATDSIYELGLLYPFRSYIFSWDSSACIWQGFLGHKLNNVVAKDTTSVDFTASVNLNKAEIQFNIEFVNKLLKGVIE